MEASKSAERKGILLPMVGTTAQSACVSRRHKGLDWQSLVRMGAVLLILFGGGFVVKSAKGMPDIVFGLLWVVVVVVVLAMLVAILANASSRVLSTPKADAKPTKKPRVSRVLRFIASSVSKGAAPAHRPVPTDFTWELLKEMEWRSFEKLVTGYFRLIGFKAERLRAGADGGVDIVLRKPGEEAVFAYVQCKAWNTYLVGVKPVRELFGVMAGDGVTKGYFVCTGTFTSEATAFAEGKPLKLVTGTELLSKLSALDDQNRAALFREVTSDDYTTPTCPSCDEKMVPRKGKDGAPFWGCRNFPKCWKNFPLRKLE